MVIIILLLALSALATLLVTVISRAPLLRTIFVNLDGWAERARFEAGELS